MTMFYQEDKCAPGANHPAGSICVLQFHILVYAKMYKFAGAGAGGTYLLSSLSPNNRQQLFPWTGNVEGCLLA